MINCVWNLFVVCSAERRQGKPGYKNIYRWLKRRQYFSQINLGFWVRLAQKIGLLDHALIPRPTAWTPFWFGLPPTKQLTLLVEGWVHVNSNTTHQKLRGKFIESIIIKQHANPSYPSLIRQLQILGILENDRLTPLGRAVLIEQNPDDPQPGYQPWELKEDRLFIPMPCNLELAWALDSYLEPLEFRPDGFIYSLKDDSLRLARQKGDLDYLLGILAIVCRQELPGSLKARLEGQPTIGIFSGLVLEFSDPLEMKRVRRLPLMRRQRVLSPRHIVVETQTAHKALKLLKRRGEISLSENVKILPLGINHEGNSPTEQSRQARRQDKSSRTPPLSNGDRAFLLMLLHLAKNLEVTREVPYELSEWLQKDLPQSLQKAALDQANTFHQHLTTTDGSKDEGLKVVAGDVLVNLQTALERQETIEILYHKPGRSSPERRRVLPSLIEQRGARLYLIGYCHLRRDQRTFRIDRIEILDERSSM